MEIRTSPLSRSSSRCTSKRICKCRDIASWPRGVSLAPEANSVIPSSRASFFGRGFCFFFVPPFHPLIQARAALTAVPRAMHPTKRKGDPRCWNYHFALIALIALMIIYCFSLFVSGMCNFLRAGNLLVSTMYIELVSICRGKCGDPTAIETNRLRPADRLPADRPRSPPAEWLAVWAERPGYPVIWRHTVLARRDFPGSKIPFKSSQPDNPTIWLARGPRFRALSASTHRATHRALLHIVLPVIVPSLRAPGIISSYAAPQGCVRCCYGRGRLDMSRGKGIVRSPQPAQDRLSPDTS